MLLPTQPINRLKASLAQSVIRTQTKASSIFVSSTIGHLENSIKLKSKLKSPIEFIPKLMNHHDHSSNHHQDLDPTQIKRCHMNMIFNWDPTGTCIVFRQFYVSGTASLVMYMLLLFLLALGYEYMRLATTRFDSMTRIKLGLDSNSKRFAKRGTSEPSGRRSPPSSSSSDNNLDFSKAWGKVAVPKHIQLTRSLFYVANIAVSFFLMLVVMTYNAQIIAAVLAGAFVGHFLFHRELNYEDGGKGMACH
ncbi:hypothetical protein CROQUDRAFT_656577 [Cronartium quercuum f. sp. fusiforme G11]|uniref:Copper transport protein n=1 Tax=Cronartium quercuum f. sp. fusiforme G11 TaxID=708437 RepID=A0A9P6NMY6_9BASI|nr:hypothetical protein CROQUDRAFT_656577 [Cronartium quercuum f. sp. fusiforme G11]